MNKKFPLISVVIPTYNEEKNIERCLRSIFNQDYPKESLQVMVIDDNSTDKTQQIVKRFPAELIVKDYNKTPRGAEPSKILGFTKARGDFFIYLEGDLYLSAKNYFSRLIGPLLEKEELAGSFSRCLPDHKYDSPINRFLSYHELHYDPLIEFIGCSLKETFIKKEKKFIWCKFRKEKLPPVGCCLYRIKDLKEIIKDPKDFTWVDTEIPLLLTERGKDKFAYVPDIGYYHLSVKSLLDLMKQKKRDVTKTFLPGLGVRKITYLDFYSTKDMFKLLIWIIYANLLFPSVIRAVFKIIKYHDWACIYEISTTIIITDYILFLFLKEPRGRKIIWDFFSDKFNKFQST